VRNTLRFCRSELDVLTGELFQVPVDVAIEQDD
jgi:hypothetical protein